MPGASLRQCKLVSVGLRALFYALLRMLILPGNTIMLALGASHQPQAHPHLWLEALMAIFFFFVGAFSSARVGRLLGSLQRSTLALSFLVQTTLIVVAAALIQANIVPGGHTRGTEDYIQILPLPMLSFQAGQQCVAARHLGFNEIPTTVLTSVLCDLGNDPELFFPLNENWKRNRRFLSFVLLFAGAVSGGWLSKTNSGMAAGLWMAAAIKACITVAWLFWSKEKGRQ
jgi:uncharacterized membrane protein YoaK (UPF0700 family)